MVQVGPDARASRRSPVRQDRLQRLGQGDVCRVIDGQVLSQLPAARDQRGVVGPLKWQRTQVRNGQCHPTRVQLTAAGQAPPHGDHLEVDQARGGQSVTAQARSQRVAVLAVVEKCDGEDAGVNDEHARSAVR
jgi:hypothetical protein